MQCPKCQSVNPEGMKFCGGLGLALKELQHDEARLIFLDMVSNLMPAFEQKAEALHWFPMFRIWFGLRGLCNLPWNDIVPEDNNDTGDPAKMGKHVEYYAQYFNAVTGRNASPADLNTMSESVYNFQRILNLKMGFGSREHDQIRYRAMGPVTVEEYESRQDRYDDQLAEKLRSGCRRQGVRGKTGLAPRIPSGTVRKIARRGIQTPGLEPGGYPYP